MATKTSAAFLVGRLLSDYDIAKNLTKEEVECLLTTYMSSSLQKPVLESITKGSLLVVGDIHGDFSMMKAIVSHFTSHKLKPEHLVFLGDIVDRGSHSIACLNLLFALSLKYPKRVHFLRGNHETFSVNTRYGFLNEVLRFEGLEPSYQNSFHYTEPLPSLFKLFNQVFATLPLAMIHKKFRFFFVHGGIPIDNFSLKAISKLPKNDLMVENPIIMQLLWNDPNPTVKRYSYSLRGNGIYTFGEDLVKDFLETNDLTMIVRAHEVVPEGYRYLFDKQLLSLFTSEEYYTYVQAKVAFLSKNGDIKIFSPK